MLCLNCSYQLLRSYESLLAGSHILQCELALRNLRLASKRYERHLLCVGISHLLLHLHAVRINLCAYASLATLTQNRQTVSALLLAEVDEEQLCAVHRFLRIKVKTAKHVVDTVGTERDTYTAMPVRLS